MYTLIIEDHTGNIIDEFSFEQGNYNIGRVDGNHIVLPSNSVSRNHAKISSDQNSCYIEDLGSSNGVLVNGHKIPSRTKLSNAARIQVGDFTIYLEISRQAGGRKMAETQIVGADSGASKLVRVGDMFAGEEFGLIGKQNTIGRIEINDILLSDNSISREHARIDREDDRYTAMDLGSSNGSLINGKAIKKPTLLKAGDELQFGNLRFIFAPGNQSVDLAAYASPNRGGQGTTLILGGVLVLILGIAIAFVLYFVVIT